MNDSKEELEELLDAARELLNMSMFIYWLEAYDREEDKSFKQSIERMRAAWIAIGHETPTLEEFAENTEALLRRKPR